MGRWACSTTSRRRPRRPSTSTATRSPPGIDKAADLADKKTKGKHAGQIDTGVAAAKNALDKLDGRNDDIPDDPKPKPHPPKPHPPTQ